jgi:hypothetical protein
MKRKYLIFLWATIVVSIILVCLTASTLGKTYKVTVTRVNQDFYRIDGTDKYIRTQFCYEYAYGQEVVIDYKSATSLIKGKIIFLGEIGSTYDILGVYQEVSLE